MLHYTAGTDLSGLQWLLFDPACKVSYNWLILDDGTTVSVAPQDARAWHAGACHPSNPTRLPYRDANSAFYGIAIAAQAGESATKAQLDMVATIAAGLFRAHGWPALDVSVRLTDHAAEAWPRGRKVDTGSVLPLHWMQRKVESMLRKVA
jgi:N-acetyl-anhydromuramyl-L-alanine amidase AmpD